MKKNDLIFLLSSIAYTVLFYEHNAGLNWLLFTFIVSGCLLAFNPQKRFDLKWWYYAVLAIFSSSMVFCVNSGLSIFTSVCAIIMLCGKTVSRDNSVILSFAFSIYSLLSSLIYWIIDLAMSKTEVDTNEKKKHRRVITGVIISMLIAFIFFLLYREANPLFKDLTKELNFDWLNIGWILFTFWGFLIMYGLIKSRRIEFIANFDQEALKNIQNKASDYPETLPKHSWVMAFSLFILLNIMLVLINILDFHNIFISKTLPKGITLSSFVHQAVWSTVASITIAASLIMWFFKGELNFNTYGKKVKFLVYAWIVQSIIMVLSTIIRNSWYIQEYQLTYLRIGVYTFLILSLVGLIHTFLKVAYGKSAWGLVSTNFSTWFLLLCFSSSVNWDKIITHYNITHANEKKKLDLAYLVDLSDANIPELIESYKLHDTTLQIKEYWDTPALDRKLYNAFTRINETCWQDINLRVIQNKKALNTIKFDKHDKK